MCLKLFHEHSLNLVSHTSPKKSSLQFIMSSTYCHWRSRKFTKLTGIVRNFEYFCVAFQILIPRWEQITTLFMFSVAKIFRVLVERPVVFVALAFELSAVPSLFTTSQLSCWAQQRLWSNLAATFEMVAVAPRRFDDGSVYQWLWIRQDILKKSFKNHGLKWHFVAQKLQNELHFATILLPYGKTNYALVPNYALMPN